MRKKLNRKVNEHKKTYVVIAVITIFLIYVSLALTVSERRYLYVESAFKSMAGHVNKFFINQLYKVSDNHEDFMDAKENYYKKENDELKKLLDIKNDNVNYVLGVVTNRTFKTWSKTVEINLGYDKKITNNLPVINPNGLVGFVSKTGKNISEVKLLTSVNEDDIVSVFIQTDDGFVSGFLSDYDEKRGLFKVTDVTSKLNIKKEDKVVLSGYDEELYKGILVGYVVSEEKTSYGLAKTVWVKPGVSFDDLMFVLVPVKEDN